MIINQLSVFVENKIGRLTSITKVMADNNVDIRAMSIADTTDFGILRLIVDDSEKAKNAIREAGFVVSITKVIAIDVEDKPGALANVLSILSKNETAVEYMYAFIGSIKGRAFVILKVNDNEKAIEVLKENGVALLEDNGIC